MAGYPLLTTKKFEYVPGEMFLDDLTDVDTTGKSDEDVLTWNSGAGRWEAGSSGGSLSGLADVIVTSLQDNDFLRWVTARNRWENTATIGDIGDLDNVDVGSATNLQVLTYDGNAGGTWIASNVPKGTLNDLTDVSVGGVTDGQMVAFNSTSGKWEAVDAPIVGEPVNNWHIANNSTDFGSSPTASGTNAYAVGYGASALGENSLAIGHSASNNYIDAIAIGTSSTAGNNYSIAIGKSATSDATNNKLIIQTNTAALRVHSDGTLETSNDGGMSWGAIEGGGSGSDKETVVGTIDVGKAVYFDGADWQLAKADDRLSLATHFVVDQMGANMTVQQSGFAGVFTGLMSGTYYYVSPTTAGAITEVEPTGVGEFSNPILLAQSSTSGWVLPYRPSVNVDVEVSNRTPSIYTDVAGRSEFSIPFEGMVDVYLSGSRLVPDDDYSVVGTTVTLALPVQSPDDVVAIFTWQEFAIADAVSKQQADLAYAEFPRPRRNLLINGDFSLWQRSVGPYNTQESRYTADRWYASTLNASSYSLERKLFDNSHTSVPGNPRSYMEVSINTSGAVNEESYILQRIEGPALLQNENCVLSFWAKSDAARKVYVGFDCYSGSVANEWIAPYVLGGLITLTSDWKRYEIPITFPDISSFSSIDDNGFIQVRLWMSAGSDYSGQTGSLGNQSGVFSFSNVQLENGSIATDFERLHPAENLALCQRYFWKLDGSIPLYLPMYASTAVRRGYATFPVTMRVRPTISEATVNNGTIAGTFVRTDGVYISSIAASVSSGQELMTLHADAEV